MASPENISLSDELAKAKGLIDAGSMDSESAPNKSIIEALGILENLQIIIQRVSLFSKNEEVSDIQTSTIPLILVEYYMAKALLQIRTTTSLSRNSYVRRALELFRIFLHRCQEYDGLLLKEALESYRCIEAMLDSRNEEEIPALPPQSRDDKISNFRKTRNIQSQISHIDAKLAQRKRLGIAESEELDGHDRDGLERLMYLNQINEAAFDSISELYSLTLELQMLKMAVKMEEDCQNMSQYNHHHKKETDDAEGRGNLRRRPLQNSNNQKLQMTQVLQHPVTGELIFKRQELQSSVFKPSWNQPTMTLEELAQKEVKDAIEREARQKLSEAEQKNAPRRYEYLVRDGLEDDATLVDASAKLDRVWDEWKEQNPRGSGNKMADRGDRNF